MSDVKIGALLLFELQSQLANKLIIFHFLFRVSCELHIISGPHIGAAYARASCKKYDGHSWST
jgi:hypothetical protein